MGEPAVPGVGTSRIVHVLRNRMGVGKIDLQAAAEIERLEARALAAEAALAGERERAAKIAEGFSNAKPGDICEVQAAEWQYGIAAAIRAQGE